MTYDPELYRGFRLNIEMSGGKFVPTYHDPLDPRHHGKGGQLWAKLPKCADPSKDRAVEKAHTALDELINLEVARTSAQIIHAAIKVE